MNELTTPVLVIAAYLVGSLSAAILVCKLLGLPDPRTEGSKNPGATNVLRLGGKKAALLTLLGDMLKGLIPVAIAVQISTDEWTIALTLLAAFLGHHYPLFFGFKGGKGVATARGGAATARGKASKGVGKGTHKGTPVPPKSWEAMSRNDSWYLNELWSVFDFVQPKIFGSYPNFAKKYADNI